MSRSNAQTIAIVLAVVAAFFFLNVANTEFSYASDHPHAFGPAKVIASGAVGGVILAVAVAVLAWGSRRED
jgi:uncharacterized integral membrane protein